METLPPEAEFAHPGGRALSIKIKNAELSN
jgi:hypothetical protein